MQASAVTQQGAAARVDKRDWVAWYDELAGVERREIRDRLLDAAYDEVKADPELRQFFFFHSEDLVAEGAPGTERLAQLHAMVAAMRGASDSESVEKRRKAVGFLLAEYQRWLRDNPWSA